MKRTLWAVAAILLGAFLWKSRRQDSWILGRTGSQLQTAKVVSIPEPHPEVLNLQEAFATVSALAKPAVVNISIVHVEKVQIPQFFFGDPEEFFYEFFYGR